MVNIRVVRSCLRLPQATCKFQVAPLSGKANCGLMSISLKLSIKVVAADYVVGNVPLGVCVGRDGGAVGASGAVDGRYGRIRCRLLQYLGTTDRS